MSSLDDMFHTLAKSKWNKDRLKRNDFAELNGPFLMSSGHLNNLYNQTDDKTDHECILDHMYKFEACEIDSYSKIEKKIIEKWR